MIIVYKLTEIQKDIIINKRFDSDQYFNPIQDIDNNWIISKEEVDQSLAIWGWVKNLPAIEWKPKPEFL